MKLLPIVKHDPEATQTGSQLPWINKNPQDAPRMEKLNILRGELFYVTLAHLNTQTVTPWSLFSMVTFLHKLFLKKTNTQIFETCSINTGWGERVWKSSKSLKLTGIKMPMEVAIKPIVVLAFSFYSQQSKVQNTLKLLQYLKQLLNY